ncbi:MAG: sensor histidine kinase, partial [Nocardioidaceae bacterium]
MVERAPEQLFNAISRGRAGKIRGAGAVLLSGALAVFLLGTSVLRAPAVVVPLVVTIAGLGVIGGPVAWRLLGQLGRERAERIRSQERAEMAAHLHDSVLQTLAIIQRTADDPRAVVAMARRQERELRGWLYNQGEAERGSHSLAAALARTAEEVEGLHGVPVEVVHVGDCPVDERLDAMVGAAREAMVNASKWSGEKTISVYTEVRDDAVSMFVRDWGKGFDVEAIGPDHHGIRESIRGR